MRHDRKASRGALLGALGAVLMISNNAGILPKMRDRAVHNVPSRKGFGMPMQRAVQSVPRGTAVA